MKSLPLRRDQTLIHALLKMGQAVQGHWALLDLFQHYNVKKQAAQNAWAVQQGDIFVVVSGEDSQEATFYQVIKQQGRWVTLQQLRHRVVQASISAVMVVPLKGMFSQSLHHLRPMLKLRGQLVFRLPEGFAFPWNGRPQRLRVSEQQG